MATKDYVYLALIALSALVFYLHGYYAGTTQRRRRLGKKNGGSQTSSHVPSPAPYVEPVIYVAQVELDEVESDVAHRAARLYRFDRSKYNRLTRRGFLFEI